MELTGLAALLATAASGSTVPVWAYMIVGLVPAVGALLGGVRWYTNRMEKRLLEAQGTVQLATADLTEQQSEKIKEELRLSVLESVRDDMARQREETMRAQAAEKEAIAEVAMLIAQHTRDRAEWKEERHDFINQLRDRDNQITLLRGEVETLRAEVQTLRVALGVEQGRRFDDDRMTLIEKRAEVSESRAVEQEHRNDDTPGHA